MTAAYQQAVKGIRERVESAVRDLQQLQGAEKALNSLLDALAHLRVEENKEGKQS
jgi:outer membrane protein TolC